MPYLQPEQSDSGPADAPQSAPVGATPAPLKRIRKRHFERAKRDGIKITALTSYDMLTASIFDAAGVDLLLVGDSAANNVLGYSSTVAVTVDELLPLARAVAGAAKRAFVVADLPFGSYELSDEQALATSFRFMKEAGVHAVKLEGGVARAERIRHIVSAGIPVMGHIGFTPQSEHQLGGHLVQGRGEAADAVLADALAVQDAGAFAVVLELMPAELARRISEQLDIPTIGIGAGPGTDGQILVWTDFAGLNTGRYPAFVKKYAELAEVLGAAAREYVAEVTAGSYPGPEHSYE